MATLTMKQKFRKALEARGEIFVKETHKYTVMTRHRNANVSVRYYYLGNNGALRVGANVTSSRPCNSQFKQSLLSEAGQ